MNFVFKLFALIISSTLVQSMEPVRVWKSFKLNEKMIYDCVDIYKQPSLNHPLLQNHKIQMNPSFSIHKSRNQVDSKTYKKLVDCPNGTVPILRNTKEYVSNTHEEKHFIPMAGENRENHFAAVRLQGHGPYYAVASYISVHDLNISGDQISHANIYVSSRVDNKYNSIQAGWMINPSLFGDGRPWSYGYWKGANGAGCYNTLCPGFVQVSQTDPLSEPLPEAPQDQRNIAQSIQWDSDSGNWWVTDIQYKKHDILIGYWPKELFDIIGNGVDTIGAGGAVLSSSSGQSPPMGNGNFPTDDDMKSAHVKRMFFIDSSKKYKRVDKSQLEKVLDSPKCYGLKWGKDQLFTFGGPGGNSCEA